MGLNARSTKPDAPRIGERGGTGGKHKKPRPVSIPAARSTARTPSLPRAGGGASAPTGHTSSNAVGPAIWLYGAWAAVWLGISIAIYHLWN